MQPDQAESLEGVYDVFFTDDDTRLIVLFDLDPAQQVMLYPMQEFMLSHLDFFRVFYWLLLASVVTYLVGTYVVIPLMREVQSTNP